jgi:hypothetical protein
VLSTGAEWVSTPAPVRGALVRSRPMLGAECVVLAGASTCHLVALPTAPRVDTAAAVRRSGVTEAAAAAEEEEEDEDEEDEELSKLKIPPGPWQGARARKAELAPGGAAVSFLGDAKSLLGDAKRLAG